jgi:cyanophycinase
MSRLLNRSVDRGWLVLLGGGEFSFGETLAADEMWIAKLAEGPVGFLPAASGSADYGSNYAKYLEEAFNREVSVIPIYRSRDARRQRNVERIEAASAIYMGGGVADQLVETLAGTPSLEALNRKFESGGVVVAIAGATQACGAQVRSLLGRQVVPGLGWLVDGVVEPNFDPAHDRRLRQLMEHPDVRWGMGLPASSAVLLGPGGEQEILGPVFILESPDDDFEVLNDKSIGEG